MPLDIENEGRFLASKLDQSRTNEVTSRLQQDSQYLDQRGYSALLHTINRYDQKGVGDDLIIVNNRDGSQEALIKPHVIDVGRVVNDAPPPQPGYYAPAPYPNEGYAPPPPPQHMSDAGCTVASAGVGAVIGNILSPWRSKGVGTAAGAVAGAVVGSEACNNR
jgi:hypothetical protein